jgi:hypothetical protein
LVGQSNGDTGKHTAFRVGNSATNTALKLLGYELGCACQNQDEAANQSKNAGFHPLPSFQNKASGMKHLVRVEALSKQ